MISVSRYQQHIFCQNLLKHTVTEALPKWETADKQTRVKRSSIARKRLMLAGMRCGFPSILWQGSELLGRERTPYVAHANVKVMDLWNQLVNLLGDNVAASGLGLQ